MAKKTAKEKAILGTTIVFGSLYSAFVLYTSANTLACPIVSMNVFHRTDLPDYSLVPGKASYEEWYSYSHPRTEMGFTSNGARLQGYLYRSKASKGLIVFSHGIYSGADSYLPLETSLVDRGFDVFSYDGYGCYRSEGSSMIGFPEAIVSLESAVSFVKSNVLLKGQKLFLMGHSWGGYSSAAVSGRVDGIDGVVTCSAPDQAEEMMASISSSVMGKSLSGMGMPFMNRYSKNQFGSLSSFRASDSLFDSDVPALVMHGDVDEVVPRDSISLYHHLQDKITDKFTYWLPSGAQGKHSTMFLTKAAIAYQDEIKDRYEDLKKQYDGKIPHDVQVSFYSSVDDEKYSEIDQSVVDAVEGFLNLLL